MTGPTRIAVAVVLGIIAGAWTASEANADPRATISITVIHAKKGPPFLHSSLEPMWETLKKSFGDRFAFYNLVTAGEKDVDPEGTVEVEMPDREKFTAQYRGVTEEKGLLRIAIAYGEFQSKVRISSGGLFFQAGKKYRDGTLVIGVKATLVK